MWTQARFSSIAFALLLFGLGAASLATAQNKVCTEDQEKKASSDVDRLKDWPTLYRSFREFVPQCDDGEIAEGYSDAVAKLLANHWKELPALVRLVTSDPAFKRFVLRHIDATISADDLTQIDANARLRCPSNGKHLCSLIAAEAKTSLKEIANPR